jgi:hypothetical protein
MGVSQDYEIFKNALIYTTTFRITSQFMQHSEGSVLSLTASSFIATLILQRFRSVLNHNRNQRDVIVRPMVDVADFLVETLVSAAVHMQSNLLGTYASRIFDGSADPLYAVISSIIGLVLIWLMGVTIKNNV